ncbi:response regulator receiver sensor signal transduction histidine kinase [Phaffia rhodozyma]|uniref:Response regulator receiver sensor signal transduction histidine kinase n=1 Tax=Phaffia rhodozyma TaxID=264483 RepID=A0A0F7SPA7_PHARH|nr:response regulator receiver sensor signal transduction histidine kinase [Phaffia rhodozyma]
MPPQQCQPITEYTGLDDSSLQLPLIPFLRNHPTPSIIIALPHPTQHVPFRIRPIWSNPVARIGTNPLLGCIDDNSNLILQVMIAKLARQLASQRVLPDGIDPSKSQSTLHPNVSTGTDSTHERKRIDSFQFERPIDPSMVSASDLIYTCPPEHDAPEGVYFPTLVPIDSDGSYSSPNLSEHRLAVLQLCPVQGAIALQFQKPYISDTLSKAIPSAPSAGKKVVDEPTLSVSMDSMGISPYDGSTDTLREDPENLKRPTQIPLSPRQARKTMFNVQQLLDNFDWQNTPLGPKALWPQSLKSLISVVMNTDHESTLWWGKDLTLIYNDAYAEMLLRKHPFNFGKVASVAWSEVWPELKSTALNMMAGGRAVNKTDDLLFFQREVTKAPEETYTTWSWIPVAVENGEIGGLLNYSVETTSNVLARRRFEMLRSLAQSLSVCQSLSQFSEAALNAMAENVHDLPFIMLYSPPTVQNTSTTTLDLLGTIGVPAGHPSAPTNITLDLDIDANSTHPSVTLMEVRSTHSEPSLAEDTESIVLAGSSSRSTSTRPDYQAGEATGCPWPIAQALTTNEMVFVEDCSSLVTGFEVRSWPELPETAVVIPISDEDSRKIVFICGLNSRRPYDKDYQSWIRLLKYQLASGLKGVASFQAQLVKAEELAKLDRAKTTFFSNTSHELRSPLTLIQGPIADLLAMETNGGSRKRLLSLADRNCQRLTRLVNMLMDVSQVDAGRMKGVFSPKQLGVYTADLASLFRSAIEKGGVTYDVDCDIEDPRLVYIDPDLYEKIIYNIIGNAFKYCLEGTIKVYLRYHANEVELSVIDTGVGIPKDDIPRIVTRFHRVASVGRSFEGTGIGLSLTAELIRLHGGTLSVESCTAEESPTGKHGSSFIVRFPLGTEHLSPDMILDLPEPPTHKAMKYAKGIIDEASRWSKEEVETSSISDSGESSNNSNKIDPSTLFWSKSDTVLIVDDNHDMRRYLMSIMSQYCTVIEACNGKEALDIVLSCQPLPDLIISDVMMPIMTGFELVQTLKNQGLNISLIPVLLVTARNGDEDTVSGILMGAEDYITKPFSSREIVARAHLQMQMGKRRIELERKFAERTVELQFRAQEAEIKRQEAEEGRRQQELLIDVTSHEIRNPVSAILQNAELCKDNLKFFHKELHRALTSDVGLRPTTSLLSMIEEDVESLDAIITMAQSQERIANDVLSLARIQLSTLEIYPVQTDLVKETRKILAIFASEARLKRIDLSFTFGPMLLSLKESKLDLLTDPQRIGQVLINLLANAIRFTATSPVREIQVSVEIRNCPPDDDSCVPPPANLDSSSFASIGEKDIWIYGAVKDSGPGLSEEELTRLFQRFKQASAQTHAVFGGSGLGLYVCRRICELMDGKIEVASCQDQGSTFRFFVKASLIPIITPIEAAKQITLTEKTRASSSKATLSPQFKSLVLVVEDNLINQKVLYRQLVKAGITQIDLADDGQQALNMINKRVARGESYDVVLMDLEMPVMDGLTAIQKIRHMESTGELPIRHNVLALTGNARQQQIEQALRMGMDEVVLKPYRIENLLSKLRSLGVF